MMCKFNRCGICFNCYSKHFNNDCFPCEDADPMTNADRIRSMTDEELVELHYSSSAHCIADDPTVCDRHDFIGNLTPCEQCYLKWLQQPAKEADHA